MNSIYNIQPVSVGVGLQTQMSSKVRFNTAYTPKSTEMIFSYYFLDDNEEIVLFTGDDVLGEDVLAGWGENDDYIINAMANKLGVVLV